MSPQSFLTAAATLTCGLWLCALDAGHCAASERPAADGFVVQSWQTDEGLPGNAVNDVVQDRTGYIWLATIGGLVRFDGVNFKPFASPLIASDAEHNIRALAKAAGSTLLMLPAVGGVVQLKDGQFRPHPAGDGLEGKQLQTLFVAGDGAIWIGMEGGRVRRWQNGKISDFGPANGLNSRTGVSFAGDSEGRVWIGGIRGGGLQPFRRNLGVQRQAPVEDARRSDFHRQHQPAVGGSGRDCPGNV
jgi:ligand-binding sensor domain-containing protein